MGDSAALGAAAEAAAAVIAAMEEEEREEAARSAAGLAAPTADAGTGGGETAAAVQPLSSAGAGVDPAGFANSIDGTLQMADGSAAAAAHRPAAAAAAAADDDDFVDNGNGADPSAGSVDEDEEGDEEEEEEDEDEEDEDEGQDGEEEEEDEDEEDEDDSGPEDGDGSTAAAAAGAAATIESKPGSKRKVVSTSARRKRARRTSPGKRAANRPKNRRKNIRAVLTTEELNPETLAAKEREQKRVERLKQAAAAAHAAMLANSQSAAAAGRTASNAIVLDSDDDDEEEDDDADDIVITKVTSPPLHHPPLILKLPIPPRDPKPKDPSSSSAAPQVVVLGDSDDEDDAEDVQARRATQAGQGESSDIREDESFRRITFLDDSLNVPEADGSVVVNPYRPAGEPAVTLAPELAAVVKPHQIGGIRFMWSNCVEDIETFKKTEGAGCILAHAMGLGKTLQVISFAQAVLRHTPARTLLAVVPVNTLQNWIAEFNRWLRPENRPNIFSIGDSCKTLDDRIAESKAWQDQGGVMIIGYEMYRMLVAPTDRDNRRERKRRQGKDAAPNVIDVDLEETVDALQESLRVYFQDPGPDIVVCDEGHRIKNRDTGVSKAMKTMKTKRRIVLTGYPLQNNLTEYWCMVDFVRPDHLGSYDEFQNMFERPIANGQCLDSTEADFKLMRFQTFVLNNELKTFVQRRSHDILKEALPEKFEYILCVRLTRVQEQLYCTAIKNRDTSGANLFKFYTTGSRIWNHPDLLYKKVEALVGESTGPPPDSMRESLERALSQSSDAAASSGGPSSTPSASGSLFSTYGTAKPPPPPAAAATAATATVAASASSVTTGDSDAECAWAVPFFHGWKEMDPAMSGKVQILFDIIRITLSKGERLLVFSQSLETLSLLEASGGERWERGRSYFRLDGSTSATERQKLIDAFNTEGEAQLFLLSTKAGGLGINLTGASRVVIFDSCWNPCHDAQAVCRVYRFGQERGCHIYRLIADGTLEKKIYDRQVQKQGLFNRVVETEHTERMFSAKELEDLFRYERPPKSEIEDPSHGSDPVLAQICQNMAGNLSKTPFQHESLLIEAKEHALSRREQLTALREHKERKEKSRQQQRTGSLFSTYTAMAALNGGDFYGQSMSEIHNRVASEVAPHLLARIAPRPPLASAAAAAAAQPPARTSSSLFSGIGPPPTLRRPSYAAPGSAFGLGSPYRQPGAHLSFDNSSASRSGRPPAVGGASRPALAPRPPVAAGAPSIYSPLAQPSVAAPSAAPAAHAAYEVYQQRYMGHGSMPPAAAAQPASLFSGYSSFLPPPPTGTGAPARPPTNNQR